MSHDVLLCRREEKAQFETRNGVEQLDYITSLVEGGASELRESHVLTLQQLAVDGIYPCAGKFRDARTNVLITNSDHVLPEPALVQNLVRDACDWINGTKAERSALERASYALWRFNWIHPFSGGNGRTSRALAYMILCMKEGRMLPGVPSMPTLIYDHRDDYILALRAVDKAEREAKAIAGPDETNLVPDFSAMTAFLESMLTHQFANAIKSMKAAK